MRVLWGSQTPGAPELGNVPVDVPEPGCGQWWEPLLPRGARLRLCPGAALPGRGVVCDGVLVVVVLVEVVELAAFASAAPPPTSPAVTASVVTMGLIRCRMSFTSLVAVRQP
jgi:hypothetical protein